VTDSAIVPPAFAEVSIGPNRVFLLKDGAQAFPSMLSAIARARSTLCLETYILESDQTGRRFVNALCERARSGVEVNLLFDDWGSTVSEDLYAMMQEAGVRWVRFLPVRLAGRWAGALARLRRRNHRKALIVDGEVAFTGGLNISNDYTSVEEGGLGWRDTHVRIEGPAAQELERLFLDTWRRAKGPKLTAARYKRQTVVGDGKVKIIGNDFAKDSKDVRKAYVDAMTQAKQRIYLTHAYFLPPNRVLKAMIRAARRGVEVAVILAATTDVGPVLWAARGLYPKLLKAGVKVFEWEGRVLHAKTAVVDGLWCTVGSANLDALSLRSNLEVNAVINDTHFAAAVEKMFVEDLASCVQVNRQMLNERGLLERLLTWLAYRLRAWL
jgi:cardiolipin synthase